MPSDINPFEPWRPRDSAGGEEMYPWRTPPQDQGLPEEDDRNVPYYRRRDGKGAEPEEDRPVPPPSGANAFSVLLLIVLVISTLVASGMNGGGHFWRFAAAAASAWLGFFAGASLLYRSSWLPRVGTIACGVASCVLCYMFLPTSGGLSWWEARNRLVALEKLAPGDLEGFRASGPARAKLLREFPAWKGDLNRAETAWARRTVQAVNAEAQSSDARKAMRRVEEAEKALATSSQPGNFQADLATAWAGARKQRIGEITAAANALADKKDYIGAQKLAMKEGEELRAQVERRGSGHLVTEEIDRLRLALFDRQLAGSEAYLRALQDKGRYDAVRGEGRRLLADLEEAGNGIGRQPAARELLNAIRRNAAGKQLAELEKALSGLKGASGDDKAAAALGAELAALQEEARLLNEEGLRARATAARILLAARPIQELLNKKDYAAVPERAEAIRKQVRADPTLAPGDPELFRALAPIRTRAFRARLGLKREALRGLLVKDAFGEIGPLGEQALAELDGEAAYLGLRAELADFTSRCRAIARLAAEASRKE